MKLLLNAKVSKTALKNDQCWLNLRSEFGEYLGTVHIVIPEWAEKFSKCKNVVFEEE